MTNTCDYLIVKPALCRTKFADSPVKNKLYRPILALQNGESNTTPNNGRLKHTEKSLFSTG